MPPCAGADESFSCRIASVTAIEKEIGDVDMRLAEAEAKERELLERLGGAKV